MLVFYLIAEYEECQYDDNQNNVFLLNTDGFNDSLILTQNFLS